MMKTPKSRPVAMLLAAVLALGACADVGSTVNETPQLLSDMKLGHVVIVAKNAQKVPISRDATPEEWQAALGEAITERFGVIGGERLYHFGIHVDGYALAPPGVPLVVSPKSILVITANIWDNARGDQQLNAEGRQLTIFEGLSGETVIGSGLTRSREEQMRTLSRNAAKAIEDWLLENPQWFDESAQPRVAVPAPPRN